MRAQVLNNCHGPHYIQGQPVDKGGAKKVAGPLLILKPGLNLVDTKDLAERRKVNKSFDDLFKMTVKPTKVETADPSKFGRKMLEVVGKELDDAAPLAKLSFEEASGVIAMTADTDLISDWMKSTKPGDPLVKVLSDRAKELSTSINTAA
jgi:hypothetical protein